MSMAAGTSERNKAAALALKDPTLLRARCFVGGALIEADDGRTFDVVNPATGDTLGAVPSVDRLELEAAGLKAEGRVRVMQDNRRADRRGGGRGELPRTFRDE